MGESNHKTVNFLRGIPAEEALSKLLPKAAEGYKHAVEKYGTDVLQYGHFNGFKPLRDILGSAHHVDPNRVVAGNGGHVSIPSSSGHLFGPASGQVNAVSPIRSQSPLHRGIYSDIVYIQSLHCPLH